MKRQMVRESDRRKAEAEIFGREIAEGALDLSERLIRLADAVQNKELTFNPLMVEILENLNEQLPKTIEVLKNE